MLLQKTPAWECGRDGLHVTVQWSACALGPYPVHTELIEVIYAPAARALVVQLGTFAV